MQRRTEYLRNISYLEAAIRNSSMSRPAAGKAVRYDTVYPGIVMAGNDTDDGKAYCRVYIPALHDTSLLERDEEESLKVFPPARIAVPLADDYSAGNYFPLEKGSLVWVIFEDGDPNYPLVIGGFFPYLTPPGPGAGAGTPATTSASQSGRDPYSRSPVRSGNTRGASMTLPGGETEQDDEFSSYEIGAGRFNPIDGSLARLIQKYTAYSGVPDEDISFYSKFIPALAEGTRYVYIGDTRYDLHDSNAEFCTRVNNTFAKTALGKKAQDSLFTEMYYDKSYRLCKDYNVSDNSSIQFIINLLIFKLDDIAVDCLKYGLYAKGKQTLRFSMMKDKASSLVRERAESDPILNNQLSEILSLINLDYKEDIELDNIPNPSTIIAIGYENR